eukprot:TRINITY_DN13375_c1_g5_i1.p1 TRINITY_DN13375_c1_g5~~TRINITY_DN13375_c1_g5_i1.p1  ORF type:complete len:241 (-),score=14.98 TRINITY_DN13375_c1_g5_i1:5-727(-)
MCDDDVWAGVGPSPTTTLNTMTGICVTAPPTMTLTCIVKEAMGLEAEQTVTGMSAVGVTCSMVTGPVECTAGRYSFRWSPAMPSTECTVTISEVISPVPAWSARATPWNQTAAPGTSPCGRASGEPSPVTANCVNCAHGALPGRAPGAALELRRAGPVVAHCAGYRIASGEDAQLQLGEPAAAVQAAARCGRLRRGGRAAPRARSNAPAAFSLRGSRNKQPEGKRPGVERGCDAIKYRKL